MNCKIIKKIIIKRFGSCKIQMNFFCEDDNNGQYEYIESNYEFETNGNCELSEDDFYYCLVKTIKHMYDEKHIVLFIPNETLDRCANELIGLQMWL